MTPTTPVWERGGCLCHHEGAGERGGVSGVVDDVPGQLQLEVGALPEVEVDRPRLLLLREEDVQRRLALGAQPQDKVLGATLLPWRGLGGDLKR